MPLADTVMNLLPDVGGAKLPLTVVHTHSHRDHRAGDVLFQQLPGVTVAAADLDGVRQFFGFADWPNGTAQIDLGDRIVDVIPTPGHTDSHVSYYDRQTALLFTGDFLLPGRLIIDDSAADLASAQRIAAFARTRTITHVLGGHIELDVDGRTLPMGSTHHPRERALPLGRQDVLDLPATVGSFNGLYSRHGMYVMYNQRASSRLLRVIAARPKDTPTFSFGTTASPRCWIRTLYRLTISSISRRFPAPGSVVDFPLPVRRLSRRKS